ncbi:MAG: DUF4214 domain-containing protein [Clostridia bacterium]|nr:DUF4214 domain-containing protein [Clostridia bacterium]
MALGKKIKAKTQKVVSSAVAVSLGMALIPLLQTGTTVNAGWSKDQNNTKLGVSQITEPEKPDTKDTPWKGSYIYLGKCEGMPVKYRVLDTDSNVYGAETVLLDCDDMLFTSPIINNPPEGVEINENHGNPHWSTVSEENRQIMDSYTWENCDLNSYLNGNGFLYNEDCFTKIEQYSIVSSYVESHEHVIGSEPGNVDVWIDANCEEYTALTGEKIFLLDIEDLQNETYGYFMPVDYTIVGDDWAKGETMHYGPFANHAKGDGSIGYWTRTLFRYTSSFADIYSDGSLYYDFVYCSELGVAPALNLDPNSILFSSVISGESGKTGATYKLTLIDPYLNLSVTSAATYNGNTISIPYEISGADSHDATQVSVLITDKDYKDSTAEILYYGKLDIFSGSFANGIGTIELPEELGDFGSNHIYVFAEDINYKFESDYASVPIELTNIIPSSNEETTAPDENTPSTNEEGQIQENTNTNPAENEGTQTPSQINPAPNKPTETETEEQSFEAFVERLYTVALGRESESEGKAFWCENVKNGSLTGADCAREFLNSAEFKNKNLSDDEFVKVLYSTFFNRDAQDDPDGYSFWLNSLKNEGREKVVDDFINSTEWCNVCASYGVRSGATTAKATQASDNAVDFATRLYTECLGRDPEQEGLNYWSLALTNLEVTGTQAAKEFFYSKEFQDNNYDNEEYLNRLYATFMGRKADESGFTFWLDQLNNGTSRDEVFDSFSTSPEFKEICSDYAILP